MAENIRQKVFHASLNKSMEKTERSSLLISGYFTSDNKDEYGDIITRAATETALPKYRQWKNIRLMHQPIPVGKVTRIGEEDGLEWNELEIEVIDPHAIFLVENGLLPALSIGIFVDYKDLDPLQDGGYVINAYTLAEISLVDHPANYDALLRSLPVDQSVALMVRTFGLESVSSAIQAIEGSTPESQPVIEELKDNVEPEQEGEVEQEVEAEVEPDVESTTDVEPVAVLDDADPPSEDHTAVQEPELEESTDEPAPATATLEESLAALNSLVASLAGQLADLQADFKSIKALAEAPQITEQALGDVAEIEPVPDEVDLSLDPQTDGVAVNRSGAVQSAGLPSEQPAPAEVQRDAGPSTLRDALLRHFQINTTK